MGKRRPPALPSPRGEGGIRRSHARRMTDEVSCREGRGMLPQTAQGRNSSRFPTAAEIATRLHPPQAAAGRKRLAVPGKRFGLTLARLAALPFPGLLRDGPPMARLRKLRPACICHWQRQAAIPRVFRPLRKLRVGPQNLYGAGTERLAVPEKPFGLTLILRFSDRCGNCDPPASAAGGGGSQFLIILNSGGGDYFLLVTCGIVCPSKEGIGNTA